MSLCSWWDTGEGGQALLVPALGSKMGGLGPAGVSPVGQWLLGQRWADVDRGLVEALVEGRALSSAHWPFNDHSITFAARKKCPVLIKPVAFCSIRLVPETVGWLIGLAVLVLGC